MVKSFIYKKYDFLVIIICLILVVFLLFLHHYLIANKDIFNSKVIVNSNRLIDDSYDLANNYYLLYDNIDVELNKINFSLVYTCVDSINILDGHNIENDYEIIVSEKYKSLLNKRVSLKINNDKYKFLVVGIYKNNEVINDKYIYTSETTLKDLYNHYNIGKYNYIFIVDGYTDLNKSVDLLKIDGYDVVIPNSESLTRICDYNVINDSVMLFIVILSAIVLIFVFYMIF